MGLDRFAVMGLSGGGPFALACAHALPKDMVAGVGLFASGGPWEAGTHHMSLMRRLTRTLAVYWPSGLGVMLSLLVRGFRAIATSGPIVRRLDAWLEAQDKKKMEKEKKESAESIGDDTSSEKPKKSLEERRKYLFDVLMDEPFAQGADATVLEADLLSAPDWGFKFEDVDFDPVRIWHGAKDGNSPIAVMRYLAQRLPHGVLTEYENDTHYTMFAHLEEALTELARDYDAHASEASSSS
jgi:pimeloyl-ACP methyl ester carboxylesterase